MQSRNTPTNLAFGSTILRSLRRKKINEYFRQDHKVDFFRRKTEDGKWNWDTGDFVGRPFKLSYTEASILTADAWKGRSYGIPQGCFLLAYYDCDPDKQGLQEAILLRVLEPAELPTDRDVVSSMVEYYKDHIRTGATQQSQLDQYSRYEFSFSGVKCKCSRMLLSR